MTEIIAIEQNIILMRGQKVLLDNIWADLYGVETKVLLQAVKRNIDRLPDDFIFQLTKNEFQTLRSQNVISKGRGGRRYPPYTFTEQGASMLSSVLRSKRAIMNNIEIMRTFAKLRQFLAENVELAKRLNELEQQYDQQFKIVFDAIRVLMKPDESSSKPIGFIWENENQ